MRPISSIRYKAKRTIMLIARSSGGWKAPAFKKRFIAYKKGLIKTGKSESIT